MEKTENLTSFSGNKHCSAYWGLTVLDYVYFMKHDKEICAGVASRQ